MSTGETEVNAAAEPAAEVEAKVKWYPAGWEEHHDYLPRTKEEDAAVRHLLKIKFKQNADWALENVWSCGFGCSSEQVRIGGGVFTIVSAAWVDHPNDVNVDLDNDFIMHDCMNAAAVAYTKKVSKPNTLAPQLKPEARPDNVEKMAFLEKALAANAAKWAADFKKSSGCGLEVGQMEHGDSVYTFGLFCIATSSALPIQVNEPARAFMKSLVQNAWDEFLTVENWEKDQ